MSNQNRPKKPYKPTDRALQFHALAPDALVRLNDVIYVVPLNRASIYSQVQKGRFPAPIKLTAHASGWRVRDIRAWLVNPTAWKADDNGTVS